MHSPLRYGTDSESPGPSSSATPRSHHCSPWRGGGLACSAEEGSGRTSPAAAGEPVENVRGTWRDGAPALAAAAGVACAGVALWYAAPDAAAVGRAARHNCLAATAAVLVGLNLAWCAARSVVSGSASKHPALVALRGLPVLRLSEPPATPWADLRIMLGIYAFVAAFYGANIAVRPGGPPRDEEALPVIRWRFGLNFAAMAAMTALYYAARWQLGSYVRDPEQLEQQAANLVRIVVKCSWMVYLMCYGNWWYITTCEASHLRQADLNPCYMGMWWMCSLYTWELCYRQLLPVSFIHHGAALMAGWSILELFGDDLGGMSMRKFAPCGLVMSFTEGWCCLVLLIGAMKGCSLRQWAAVMMGNCVVGAVIYNCIACWWAATIWLNWGTLPHFHRAVSCPLVLLLTYPAQMYMCGMFYAIARSLARQAAEAEAAGDDTACDDPFANTECR